jgi:hypothetical protein
VFSCYEKAITSLQPREVFLQLFNNNAGAVYYRMLEDENSLPMAQVDETLPPRCVESFVGIGVEVREEFRDSGATRVLFEYLETPGFAPLLKGLESYEEEWKNSGREDSYDVKLCCLDLVLLSCCGA